MTIDELLLHPILDLPHNWRDTQEPSYFHYIIHKGQEYLKLLASLDEIVIDGRNSYMGQLSHVRMVHDTAQHLHNALVHCLRLYLDSGSPSTAYEAFEKHFAGDHQTAALLSPSSYLASFIMRPEIVFFRLRFSDERLTEAKDLFHIPFDKRFLVRPQRYSISGFPCLYAASSVLLAHRELRADNWPPTLYAAKLRAVMDPTQRLVLLDLRNRVTEIRERYLRKDATYDGRLMYFLVNWLLTMATSVPINDRDGFHEEYVLPQIFLEWVKKSQRQRARTGRPAAHPGFDGIAFSSSRAPIEPANDGAYNIVIPVHHSNARGWCEVRTKQLELSAPITIQDLSIELSEASPTAEQYGQWIEQALAAKPFTGISPA
ncbi:hypothetical protein [Hymenobacter sp. B1770]|uniref:hypothetical protein n=1 Tax=Hymenobacter sp. B1770 TaxID=1718788 RepID=UPI003CF3EFB0